MNRPILPLAAVVSILALLAGLYASRPAESTPPPMAPPERPTPVAEVAGPASICAAPLRWRVARIDDEFGLSTAEATAAVERAEQLWERAAEHELFERDDTAGFPIAFVFDGRQAAAHERLQQQAELSERERSILADEAVLTARRERFTRIQTDYQSRLTAFNQWATSHNAVVRQWNRDGNIPEEILRELRANDERLRAEETKLTDEGRRLQAAGDSLSQEIDRLERVVDDHRQRNAALNRLFATGSVLAGRYLEARTPDGRLISGLREIQIFQFDDLTHLQLVMAHELGHSLGLTHAENPSAVMAEEHELAGASRNAGIHAMDLAMLRKRCPEL